MEKRYFSILILLFFTSQSIIKAQDLSKKQIEIIHTESNYLLNQYESVINEMAKNSNNDAIINKLKNDFIRLFLNRKIQIFNDLDPSYQLSEFYDVETYISNLQLMYPNGMFVHFDYSKIEASNIYLHKDNIWYLDVMANKRISGNYRNRTLNNNRETLSFRIAFIKEKNKFSNFRFVGIRNSDSPEIITNIKDLKELNKTEYTEEELIQVHQSAISLLLDYSRALEHISDPRQSKNKSHYAKDFSGLFESGKAMVLNDIEPKPEHELLEVQLYIEKYQAFYSGGIENISLNIDSADFSHIEKTDNKQFITYVYVNKFFTGNYKGKQKHTGDNPLVFTISFDNSNEAFTNFRIKGIDKEYSEFTGINQTKVGSRSSVPLKPITRKGSSIGLSAFGGMSLIESKNLNELSLESDNHTWKTNPLPGYSFGIDFIVFFNKNFGIKSGVHYSSYETNYQLTGNFNNPQELSFDPNNKIFIDSVQASFDSTISLQYLVIPVSLSSVFKLGKNVSFYTDLGINISFLYSSSYKLEGDFYNYGYYEQNIPSLQIISLPELGFRNDEYYPPETGQPNVNDLNITASLAIGLQFRLGYYSSLKIGPKINYGLTSITNSNIYTDIFSRKIEKQPTKTHNFGLEFSLIRKI